MALMHWKGKDLNIIRDIMDAMSKCTTPEEAQEFMRAYREAEPAADANVGYLIGYFDPRERRDEMHRLFRVQHPVFGLNY